jgi:hypothetical protein
MITKAKNIAQDESKKKPSPRKAKPSVTDSVAASKFNQLLDDAIFGVKKKKTGT